MCKCNCDCCKKNRKKKKKKKKKYFYFDISTFFKFFFFRLFLFIYFFLYSLIYFFFFFIIIFHSLYLLKNYSSATDAHTRARALCLMFIYFPIENQRCSIERDHKGFVISQIETNPSLGAAVVVTVMDHHPATPSCRTNVAVTFLPSLHGITPI